MKFSLVAIAIFLSAASADNCHTGIKYCAYNLIGKGDYHSHVKTAMENQFGTKNLKYLNADYALFRCNGPNDITFAKDCNTYCQVGQDGPHNDYCDS
ncbi:uncharacterized protein N7511_007309 [Penicillium nucicola]|uniref:uncharacterized protein n=1 Tax=Penicillium nucicola TaxID=1850975 RepID=UPI002545BB6F|nr:uncharacterized protein N7511_007309 [Penicillium nucicola]KAJ5757127.1 hypothetical protein N7511_007309 [Penicillium nucicola]